MQKAEDRCVCAEGRDLKKESPSSSVTGERQLDVRFSVRTLEKFSSVLISSFCLLPLSHYQPPSLSGTSHLPFKVPPSSLS